MKHFPGSRFPARLDGLAVDHTRAPVSLKRVHAIGIAAVLFAAGFFTCVVLVEVMVLSAR